ncbi:TRAP transporter small permease [Chelatococcus sp. GCM10030263]|uniref:TRAP transporter small permease n=1 Tax=Chelatococcus sp. GCM10030263 TaxID=3273387 RepID=UPI00360A3EA1
MISTIAQRGFAALGAVVVALFAIMMALTFLQVLNRYALGFQLFWTEEVIRLLLVWVVLLATPISLFRRDEIVVDLLDLRSRGLMRAKGAIAVGASIAFCAVLAWWGYAFALRGLPAESPTLGISRVWFYAPIPIGAALSIIALLCRGERREPAEELV